MTMIAFGQSPTPLPTVSPSSISKDEMLLRVQAYMAAKREKEYQEAVAAKTARESKQKTGEAYKKQIAELPRLCGRIIEVQPNGLRILGHILKIAPDDYKPSGGMAVQSSNDKVYFLKNYPHEIWRDRFVDISVKQDGNFTYNARDGFPCTIPSFLYFADEPGKSFPKNYWRPMDR